MAERLFAALQRGGSQLDTMRGEEGCAGELDLSLVGRRNERRLKLDFDPMGLLAREAEIYCSLELYKIGPHSEMRGGVLLKISSWFTERARLWLASCFFPEVLLVGA